VFARFEISDELIANIKKEITANKEMEIELSVQFSDDNKITYATVVKNILYS